MKKKISDLLENLNDLKFDSLIFIFGFNDGEYINELKKIICSKNKVFILEPNEKRYKKYCDNEYGENIKLINYNSINEESFEDIINREINYRNFTNLYIHSYNEYDKVYPNEYKVFINYIDDLYYRLAVFMKTSIEFKTIGIKNIVTAISIIKESTPIDKYFMSNKGVPAIIVSAGPSLDKNIKTLIKYKDKLDKFFIIAGNRTLKPLIENNIKPDLIVSIDPQEITYDMLSEYLNIDVPLLFCEQSNKKLLKAYKGKKIYSTQGVLKNIKELRNIRLFFVGGSVAHSSVDIARLIGCGTIVFVGQDFGYTFEKHHALNSLTEIDENCASKTGVQVKDVFGSMISTDNILVMYKKNMEFYIKCCTRQTSIKFINCSYGAEIEGANFKELEEVLNSSDYTLTKTAIGNDEPIKVDEKIVFKQIIDYLNLMLSKCDKGKEDCERILKRTESFNNAVGTFKEIIEIVDEFGQSPMNLYLKGYFEEFLFKIKDVYFRTPAMKYDKLSSNLIYQSQAFKNFFEKLKKMLLETKKIYLNSIEEINKN